jgi:hypothetical protein
MPGVATRLDHDRIAWPDVLPTPAAELGPGELAWPQEHLLGFIHRTHHRVVLVHVQRHIPHGLDGRRHHKHLRSARRLIGRIILGNGFMHRFGLTLIVTGSPS